MRERVRIVAAGVAGGLFAGAAVGALEALLGWLHMHGAGDAPAFAWALCAYGVLGAAAGGGAGVVALVLGMDAFALGLAGVATTLLIVVGRFRIVRDVLLERPPQGLVPRLVELSVMAAVVVLGFLMWRAVRGVTARRAAVTRPPVAVAALVVLTGLAALAARVFVAPPPSATPVTRAAARPGSPNVLLIGIDTLRADHLPVYGYTAGRTPYIDALARGGIRYARAFAQASWTRPAFATIFTGLYPSSHGAMHKADLLPDRVDTLAELLQRAGYRTVGFPNNANISPAFHFQQGFDEYHYLEPALFFGADDVASQLTLYNGLRLVRERFFAGHVDVDNYYHPAERVTDAAIRWLDDAGASTPFFLFVHYMDPHDPYFVHPYDGEAFARVSTPNPAPELAARFRTLYDGEIAYLDEHLGRLLDALRRTGRYDDTLIVLTADHGEEFHEHGGWWHGTTLYDEQIHVPLIVKPVGAASQGRVAEELAMSVDIAPTVLAAARLDVPRSMQGHALPLDGSAMPARSRVFAEEDFEGNILQAVRTSTSKFIVANAGNPRGLPTEQLFDVASDPGERDDRAQQARDAVEVMRAQLGQSFLEARAQAGATQQGGADRATQERLRALGYVD